MHVFFSFIYCRESDVCDCQAGAQFFRFCFRDGESRGLEVIWFATMHPGLQGTTDLFIGYSSLLRAHLR